MDQNVRPNPPHTGHVCSSKIKNEVTPFPPHLQHSLPLMRGSPGRTTVAPGGGAPEKWTPLGDTGPGCVHEAGGHPPFDDGAF